MHAGLQLDAAGATHCGIRESNQDAFLALPGLAMVADGMGGHSHGEVASSITINLLATLAEVTPLRAEDVVHALERANAAVLTAQANDPELPGMGTTVAGVALVAHDGRPHWLIVNIGDSRVYRLIAGRCVQLTTDHSHVAELVAAGRISPAQARQHPMRNVITRALGSDPAPVPDVWLVPAQPGDTFIVCSDGLTNELHDTALASIVGRGLEAAVPLRRIAERLVADAVAAGGHDNVTAVLAVARPDDQAPPVVPTARQWGGQPGTVPRSIVHRLAGDGAG